MIITTNNQLIMIIMRHGTIIYNDYIRTFNHDKFMQSRNLINDFMQSSIIFRM